MRVISSTFPGIMIICQNCGCLIGDIKPSDIYAENLIYCPLCRFQNTLEFNKSYDGIVKNPKILEENAKES